MMQHERPQWFREDLTAMLNLVKEDKINPIIGAHLPLDQISRAHEMLNVAAVPGKIVLWM